MWASSQNLTTGSFRYLTMESELPLNTKSKFLEYSNVCILAKSSRERESGWRFANELSSKWMVRFGSKRSPNQGARSALRFQNKITIFPKIQTEGASYEHVAIAQPG